MVFSDLPSVVSLWPYFWPADIPHSDDGIHLVVCVHGLDGMSLCHSVCSSVSLSDCLSRF